MRVPFVPFVPFVREQAGGTGSPEITTFDGWPDQGHRLHVASYRLSCACPWRR